MTGAFFSVAGSNTIHCFVVPGDQAFAGEAAAEAQHQRRRLGQLARLGARARRRCRSRATASARRAGP